MTLTLTLLPGQPQRVDEHLSVEVIEIVEKRLMTGDGMMRIGLRLSTPEGGDECLDFTSSETTRHWRGRRFRYLGGWRSEMRLAID